MSSSFHDDLASSPSSLSPLPYFDDDNNVERYYDNESNNKQEQDVQHFENNPVMGKSNELNAFMMQESRSATINLSNDNDHDEVDSVLDRNLKIEWMRQRVEAQLAALTKGADICLLRKQVEELRSHDSIHPNEYNSNNNEINTTLDPTSRKINSIICTQDKSTEAKANRRGNTTSSNISGNNANAPLAVAIAVETTNPEIAIDLLATAVPLSETNFPQIRTARTIHVPMTTEQDQDLEPLPLTPITKKDQELLTAADMTSFHLDDDEVQVVDSQGNPVDSFPNSSQSPFSNTDLGHLSQPSTKAPLPVAKNRCTQSSSYVERLSMTDLYGDAGIYTGELLQLKPHGLGEMHYNDGRVFSGGWNKGKWHGKGTAIFVNGDKFDGTYDMDRRHGFGVYEWKDGRVYEGEFHHDQRQGCGEYRWPDGAVYRGEFVAGHRQGEGTYTFSDGSTYTGEWLRGRYHGVGQCVWTDGRVYKGEWRDGKAHGYGVEKRADGTIRHEGTWNMDVPVRNR